MEIIACFTFLTSPASFPSQYGLGPRENERLKLQLGSLYVEDASDWEGFQLEYRECGFSAIPRSQSFNRPYSQGLTAYLESTLLELSNDVKFVEILVKTSKNTIRCSKHSPTYTHVGHRPCPTSSGKDTWLARVYGICTFIVFTRVKLDGMHKTGLRVQTREAMVQLTCTIVSVNYVFTRTPQLPSNAHLPIILP